MADSVFDDFRSRYPAQQMKVEPSNDDEVKQMGRTDGLSDLEADSERIKFTITELPQSRETAERGRHLWAIATKGAPIAKENCQWGKTLESGVIKHSNLTGGDGAHSAGELWFVTKQAIVVNGNSGRYGPDSHDEMNDFVTCMQKIGYRVASMGFDLDNPTKPNSILVGEPIWLEPVG